MRSILFFIFMLSFSIGSFAQADEPVEEHVIYYLKDGSYFHGVQVSDSPFSAEIRILNGDTISIQKQLIVKRYKERSGKIHLEKNRFHYKDGSFLDISGTLGFGANGNHTNFTVAYNRRLTDKISAGIGIGLQMDDAFMRIPLQSEILNLNVWHRSVPVFATGKYFLNNNLRRLYAHGKLGYTFGRNSAWDISEANNGFLGQYGLGLNRGTKHGVRTFFEVTQSHHFTSGRDTDNWWGWGNLPSNSVYDYNLWFNRLSFTFGLEVNLQRKQVKF